MKRLALAFLLVLASYSVSSAQQPVIVYSPASGTSQPQFPVTSTNPFPVVCESGCSGGGSSGAVFGPTAAGSPAANPPVLIGGTVDGTGTGNVTNWKVLSGIGYVNAAQWGGATLGAATAVGTEASGNVQTVNAHITGGVNTNGQKTMAASAPVVIASDQSQISVDSDVCQSNIKTTIGFNASGTIITGTSAKNTYICGGSFNISDAENVSVVEGTTVSTPCDTGAHALIGATTTDATHGMALSANEGLSMGSGGFANVIANAALADNVCILQSASGRVAGWVTYVQK